MHSIIFLWHAPCHCHQINNGVFCTSTGICPEYLKLENNVITVKAKFPIETYVDTFTYKFIKENGVIVSEQKGIYGVYELTDEKYVRVEVVAENGSLLFFQPVYDEKFFKA